MPIRLLILSALVALSARALAAQGPDTGRDAEPLLAIDSLLTIDNRGLTRFFVTLNAYRFKLATDPDEVDASANAFLIPRHGLITIDIAALLAPDDEDPFDDDCAAAVPNGNNCIAIVPQGPEGATAQVIISDTPIAGHPVAFAITVEDLGPIPQAFALLQSYPNPFTDAATIVYTVPESRSSGLPVSLGIYDRLGRLVRTLVAAQRFPGTFTVVWDGRDGAGRPVPSGLYVGRLVTDEGQRSIRITRLR